MNLFNAGHSFCFKPKYGMVKNIFLFAVIFLLGCYLSEDIYPTYMEHRGGLAEMEQIDLQRIMQDISYLSLNIGPRPAGSAKANEAASWFKERLNQLGYTPQVHSFNLPNGNEGQNILCLVKGQTERQIVIAAHLDTVAESPGANDDASGLALLVELARLFKQNKLVPENTVVLAGFGAEEEIEGFSGHTYSSLSYLKSLADEA